MTFPQSQLFNTPCTFSPIFIYISFFPHKIWKALIFCLLVILGQVSFRINCFHMSEPYISNYELLSLQRRRERWERLSHRLDLFASAGRFPGFDPVWTVCSASELIWTSDMERQLNHLVALTGLRVSPKKLGMFQFKVDCFMRTQDEN